MRTDKIRKYLIPNIPYLFILWAFLKLGTAYRLAAGNDFAHKLIGLGQTIGPAFADFAPGLAPLDWLVGIVGAVGFRLLIYFKSKNAKKFRRDAEYGSARWGTEKDIKPFVDPKFENNVILTGTEFLTMNTRPKIPANARNLNCCIIGSSGSGKTRFWLTPQLLQAHSSYVVVDPKGGVLGQVGAFLQKRGYKIKVFNSIDFSKSMHYNPLAYIRNEADILKFVDALISNTKGEGKEGDPFWTKSETLLYCALIAYIIFEGPAEDRNMNTLVDMISGMEVKEDDEDFMNAVDYMFAGLEKRKPDCFAVKQYVQRIRSNVRRYPDGWGEAHPLTGLMYCADCGSKMYVHRVNNGKRVPQYTCSAYSKVPVGTLCQTQHRINADVVMELIKELLKAVAEYSQLNREEFLETVKKAQTSQQSSEIIRLKSRLAEAKKRVQELEKLICRIYEDNILGKLPDERYAILDGQYSKEQKDLSAEIADMEAELSGYEEGRRSAEKFIALVDKYQNFEELTTYMLNEFVEKIVVHERDRKGSVETTQEVEIYFNFIGRYLPPHFGEVKMTPEEIEEMEKREARKDRLHQNYLRRKANGKQQEYYERTKAKKKAELDAKKEEIRQEDIAKGVFIPLSLLPPAEPKKGVASA